MGMVVVFSGCSAILLSDLPDMNSSTKPIDSPTPPAERGRGEMASLRGLPTAREDEEEAGPPRKDGEIRPLPTPRLT